MGLIKNLSGIVGIAATIGILTTAQFRGCNHRKTIFQKEIEGDNVQFEQDIGSYLIPLFTKNGGRMEDIEITYLTVEKSDKTLIKYMGVNQQLYQLEISENGRTSVYNRCRITSELEKPFLEEGQKKLEFYLSNIQEAKRNEAQSVLK